MWVAGLTGYSTGVIGFQMNLDTEGLSRESIVNIHATLIKEMKTKEEAFLTAYNDLLKTAIGNDDWNNVAAPACVALQRFASTVLYNDLPTATADQIKVYTEQLKKIEQSNQDVLRKLEKP